MTSEDGTHSSFQNVVSKFTLHSVQKPQNQNTEINACLKYKSDNKSDFLLYQPAQVDTSDCVTYISHKLF